METRISLSLSQLLVPWLIAFIIGLIAGVSLLAGSGLRARAEPTVVLAKEGNSGAGWVIVLGLVAFVLLTLILVPR